MIKTFNAYLERRRMQRSEAEFRRGMGWAFTAYFYENMHIDAIENYSDASRHFGELSAFDNGARQAVALLRHVENNRRLLRAALDDLKLIHRLQVY